MYTIHTYAYVYMHTCICTHTHTHTQVPGQGMLDIKMRVFVANSEDAKAVSEYIKSHADQVPASLVVLVHVTRAHAHTHTHTHPSPPTHPFH